jgi:hypothetical protein
MGKLINLNVFWIIYVKDGSTGTLIIAHIPFLLCSSSEPDP